MRGWNDLFGIKPQRRQRELNNSWQITITYLMITIKINFSFWLARRNAILRLIVQRSGDSLQNKRISTTRPGFELTGLQSY